MIVTLDSGQNHIHLCSNLLFQWTVTGQSGLCGRSVLVPVVRATEPASERVAILQLSMEGSHVRGRQWRSSCAA